MATTSAPAVTGVIEGGFGVAAPVPEAEVAVTSSGVEASDPRKTYMPMLTAFESMKLEKVTVTFASGVPGMILVPTSSTVSFVVLTQNGPTVV